MKRKVTRKDIEELEEGKAERGGGKRGETFSRKRFFDKILGLTQKEMEGIKGKSK